MDIRTYREILEKEIGNLDIAVLCLNAGTAEPGHLIDLSDELVER